MIPTTTRIFVCVPFQSTCDARWTAWRITLELIEQDPASGALFLVTGKRGTSLKALWWDKTGYCIWYERLSRGKFRLPAVTPEQRVPR